MRFPVGHSLCLKAEQSRPHGVAREDVSAGRDQPRFDGVTPDWPGADHGRMAGDNAPGGRGTATQVIENTSLREHSQGRTSSDV